MGKKKSFQHVYQLKAGTKTARLSVNKAGVPKLDVSQLRKCAKCGGANDHTKKLCWVCSEPLPPLQVLPEKDIVWLLKLEIDRRVYHNTDKSLTLSMQQLFADLIAGNFNQAAFAAWVKREEARREIGRAAVQVTAAYAKQEDRTRNVLGFVTVMIILGAIALMVYMFWKVR